MKSLGRTALIAVLILGLAVSFTACRGRRGGASTPTIANNTQGAQAASSSLQAAAMVSGSSTAFLNIANVGLSAVGAGVPRLRTMNAFAAGPAMSRVVAMTGKLSKSRSANNAATALLRASILTKGTAACTDGGVTTWDMIFDDVTGVHTADITFANCREDGSVLNGVYRMAATASSEGGDELAVTLGPSAAFTISDYSPGYGALMTKAVITGFTLAVKKTADASGASMTMTASGAMKLHDYFTLKDHELAFSNNYTTEVVIRYPTGLGEAVETISLIAKGDVSETWAGADGPGSTAVTFRDLKIDSVTEAAFEDTNISGAISIAFTPAACLKGTFTLATSALIRYDNNLGHTVSGAMIVDNVTTVLFNADGSLAVATGDESRTYTSHYEMGQECPLPALGGPAPLSSGITGTASAADAVTTVTLTWDGPGGVSRSDMDLHMNYYATQGPTATTAGTWFIDYHSGSSCIDPVGVELGSDQVDVNNDGICDIGLDFDNTSGYGPEHITATRLPAGYYVLSVNAFSSGDATVPVSVSMQIGASMFGPFTHTFTAADVIADADGINAAAWFAVADMVVDDAGTVTVKAHDAALELRHDGSFGMLAPKRAKAF